MAESACLQCISWGFNWRNRAFQPFLTSNWHFWQMAQMSAKCLLSKTEKAQISAQTQIICTLWSLWSRPTGKNDLSTLVPLNFPTMTKFLSAVFQIIYSLLIMIGRHFTLPPTDWAFAFILCTDLTTMACLLLLMLILCHFFPIGR